MMTILKAFQKNSIKKRRSNERPFSQNNLLPINILIRFQYPRLAQ